MAGDERLAELTAAVLAGSRYRHIVPDLVQRIGAQELAKGRSLKEAVKETRGKLHQVGGAYQETTPDYDRLLAELASLPRDRQSPELRDFCLRTMRLHTSTRERLPFLADFYAQTLAPLGRLHSVLDLACGLNPLALPWMPVAEEGEYYACDIFADMTGFVNGFLAHCAVRGSAGVCDLTSALPERPVQLALLLKTLPCLEQLDPTIGSRLLAGIQAEHLLVTFPARSLGGRNKGMVQNYETRFRRLLAGQPWRVTRWEFPTELAFLVSH